MQLSDPTNYIKKEETHTHPQKTKAIKQKKKAFKKKKKNNFQGEFATCGSFPFEAVADQMLISSCTHPLYHKQVTCFIFAIIYSTYSCKTSICQKAVSLSNIPKESHY